MSGHTILTYLQDREVARGTSCRVLESVRLDRTKDENDHSCIRGSARQRSTRMGSSRREWHLGNLFLVSQTRFVAHAPDMGLWMSHWKRDG